jgi:DNA polymerase III subunit delta'
MDTAVPPDVWAGVVGQPAAVAQLQSQVADPVHAYLLVGPPGSGKMSLALAFAAALLSVDQPAADRERHVSLALAGRHPDLFVVRRTGASITADQARHVVELASRAPTESARKVLVLDEFHLVEKRAPILLKIIEEPPASTVFLILAEAVPPDFVTIASRCAQIELGALTPAVVAAALVADGIEAERAAAVADIAGGDLGRARVLATDPEVAARREAWAAVPHELDGTGAAACRVVDELFARIEAAMEPLATAQAAELAELEERVKRTGERGSGRRDLEDRHKREQRRYRTDELRSGLAVLARAYRDAAIDADHPDELVRAVDAIGVLGAELVRNPNHTLQLQALLLGLPRLGHGR